MAERCTSEFTQPGGTFSYRCSGNVGHYTAHGCDWDENDDGVSFQIIWNEA